MTTEVVIAQWPPLPPVTPEGLIARAATIDMVADLRRFTDILRLDWAT